MRQTLYAIFVTLLLVLAACSSPSTPVPTSTVLPLSTNTAAPAPTETPIPFTPTLEPTATVTVIPTPEIPDYMAYYFEAGYDKKSDDSKLYFVYNEDAIHYAPDNGILFNGRLIRSWVEIDYIEDGVYKHGNILSYVVMEKQNTHQFFAKFVYSNSGALFGMNPSLAFIKATDGSFNSEFTPDLSYPIMEATLGVIPNGSEAIYEPIFPKKDGKSQPVTIPGIGEVLPITTARLVNGTGK